MLVRLLRTTAALLILVALCLCRSPLGKTIVLDETRTTCSTNMACRLAICPWQQMQTISQDSCMFFDNHCSCPGGKICIATDNYIPRNNFVTFQYVCRSPSVLLQRQNNYRAR